MTQTDLFCKLISIGTRVATGLAIAQSLLAYYDPASFAFIAMLQMLPHLKFLNIKYPTVLQKVLDYQDTEPTSIHFSDSLINKLKGIMPQSQVPEIFAKYDIQSNFLINFCDHILTMMLVLLLILFAGMIQYTMGEVPKVSSTFKKLRQTLQWNFFFSLFLTYYNGIIIHTSFEIRTEDLSTTNHIITFAFCALVNTIALVIPLRALIIGIYALCKKNKFTWKKHVYLKKVFKAKWKSYALVFQTIKDVKFYKFAFFPLLIIRICCYYAVIAYLYEYPVLQVYLIIALNLLMQLYLIVASPFKKFSKQVLYIAQELFLVIINVCVFLIVTDTQPNFDDVSDSRDSTAYAIIYCYIALVLLGAIILTVQIVQRVQDISNPKRKYQQNGTGETENSMVKTSAVNQSSTMKHLQTNSILHTSFEKVPPREMQIENENENYQDHESNKVIQLEKVVEEVNVTFEDSPRAETFGAPTARTRVIFMKSQVVNYEDGEIEIYDDDIDLWKAPDFMLFDPELTIMPKGGNTARKTVDTLTFKDENDDLENKR